jgi:biotin carboxylase
MIGACRRLGVECVAVDGNPHAPGLAVADTGEVAEITDPDEVFRVAAHHRVDGIYPAAEWGVEAAAAAAARLGLPGPSPDAAMRTRNKLALRQAQARAGQPTPGFRGACTAEEAEQATGEIGFPVIVKPVDGNASKGVRRVDAREDLPAAFADAITKTPRNMVLIEAFMDGDEYNVDGIVFEGRYVLGGITAKERSAPPYRFDKGIYMPPVISDATCKAVSDTVAQCLRAIGYETGTTHAEVIMTSEGPRIVEIAGRPGGGRIPTALIPLTYGVDYMADSIGAALGGAPHQTRRYQRGAALFWLSAQPGKVTAINGLDAARTVPGVEELVLVAQLADILEPVVDCVTRDKVGYVLTSAGDVQSAIAAAKHAREVCKIITAPV